MEHGRRRGFVYLAVGAEHVEPPALVGQPGDYPRFDSAEIRHDEGVSLFGDEGRADQLRKGVRHIAVKHFKRFRITLMHQAPGQIEVGKVVLRQVLHLYEAPGPSSGTVRAVELQQPVYASIGAYGVLHGPVFFYRSFTQFLSEPQYAQHLFFVVAL